MSNILPHRPESLPRPFIIIGEGYGDVCFVDELLKLHKINNCSVGCPSRQTERKKDSKGEMDDYLAGIAFAKTRQESVKLSGLLIILDADGDADEKFKMAVELLDRNHFPSPTEPFVVETHSGMRTAVFLHPKKGQTGTLEHIFLEAAFKANPRLEECIDKFGECTGKMKGATENQLAKMQMSSLVAACCPENPWASDAVMWHCKGNPVPIDSDCFQPLVDLIKQLCV